MSMPLSKLNDNLSEGTCTNCKLVLIILKLKMKN